MINFLQLLFKRLAFNFKASNGKGHGVHSPFVYRFITEILNDRRFFYSFETIETQKAIFIGATKNLTNKKHAANIQSMLNCLPTDKYQQLLFKMVHYYQIDSVLEIGSSLGISSAYLSAANGDSKILNLVEAPIQKLLSLENLKETFVNNVTVIEASDLNLGLRVSDKNKFGLILFNCSQINQDINLSEVLKIAKEDCILLFFSHNESFKYNPLWNKSLNYPQTSISIELMNLRILFFRKEQYEKEHYTIQF